MIKTTKKLDIMDKPICKHKVLQEKNKNKLYAAKKQMHKKKNPIYSIIIIIIITPGNELVGQTRNELGY